MNNTTTSTSTRTKRVIIMRGLPGSGKSTRANELLRREICEGGAAKIVSADDFFMKDGEYQFNSSKIGEAHSWCMGEFIKTLSDPYYDHYTMLIVDNTNSRIWEMDNYQRLAKAFGWKLEVISIPPDETRFKEWSERCVHNVPINALYVMAKRWEYI